MSNTPRAYGRLKRYTVRFGLTITLLLAWSSSGAQVPSRPTNLQVLPAQITSDSLINVMGGFTRALGVRCAYCHVAKNGVRPTADEFASDDRETKRVARSMLRMVRDINEKYLPDAGRHLTARTAVTCATCHSGVARPRTLEAELLETYDARGMDSTIALYRRLREQFYGRATYDFADFTLPTAADMIAERPGRARDALALMQLNLEFNPRSWFGYQQLGQLQAAMGDTTAAVASLERALEINPGREFIMQLLERLRRPSPAGSTASVQERIPIRAYTAGLAGVRAANPSIALRYERDSELPGSAMVVEYPAATSDPAARDVRVEADVRDWSRATAIAFRIKPQASLRFSVSFVDRNGVAYTSWTELKPATWQAVRIAFADIRPNPYFQPPGARIGAPIDVSDVKAIAFAPQGPNPGRFSISEIALVR